MADLQSKYALLLISTIKKTSLVDVFFIVKNDKFFIYLQNNIDKILNVCYYNYAKQI